MMMRGILILTCVLICGTAKCLFLGAWLRFLRLHGPVVLQRKTGRSRDIYKGDDDDDDDDDDDHDDDDDDDNDDADDDDSMRRRRVCERLNSKASAFVFVRSLLCDYKVRFSFGLGL